MKKQVKLASRKPKHPTLGKGTNDIRAVQLHSRWLGVQIKDVKPLLRLQRVAVDKTIKGTCIHV